MYCNECGDKIGIKNNIVFKFYNKIRCECGKVWIELYENRKTF